MEASQAFGVTDLWIGPLFLHQKADFVQRRNGDTFHRFEKQRATLSVLVIDINLHIGAHAAGVGVGLDR